MGELLRGKQIAEAPFFEALFTFTTPTPLDFGALVSGDVIVDSDVVIETPFDDPAAMLSFGLQSSPGNILPIAAIDPSTAGTYNNGADFPVSGPDGFRLQIIPGASTQGSGRVVVSVRRQTR